MKNRLPRTLDDDVKGELWALADQMCMYMDIPWVPKKFMELYEDKGLGRDALDVYVKMFQNEQYQEIHWKEYQDYYQQLKNSGTLQTEVPGYNEAIIKTLKEKWGFNYDDEELWYLENLYNGLLTTQNVNGALQTDQAQKLCKISLQIESRIREGADFDKLLGSYEKLVKAGDFTPKNVKNANDFDSVGEIFAYLEKTGFENKYYDGVTRDIVDGTISNIQKFCQRLYTNESSMGEEITARIEALKVSQEMENNYDLSEQYDEGNSYEFNDDESEEFEEELT